MLRYILLTVLFFLFFSMLRRIIEALRSALRPDASDGPSRIPTPPKKEYTDVKDARFEDVTNKPPSNDVGPS